MELVKVSDLTKTQKSIVESVPRGVKFLEGPAGTGKTTTGVRRALRLLTKDKVFANEVLILVPQRALAAPYQAVVDDPSLDPGGRITIGTIGSLSNSVVDLFFPLIAEEYDFGSVNRRPTFLTLETAQYHMARVVGGLIEEKAYFDTIAIARNRLYSQIIDNLNKAALVGFSHLNISDRLKIAWGDKEREQIIVYEHTQECVNLFREYCLANNLIDFSLQVELFDELWQKLPVRDYLVNKYRHLIVDNIEEDTPITHDLVLDWIPDAESVLLIRDTEAGYRRFLGAAPVDSDRLRDVVTTKRNYFALNDQDSFVSSPAILSFGKHLARSLSQSLPDDGELDDNPLGAVGFDQPRYHTEMISNVADRINDLMNGEEQVPAAEIVVLAPFLSDSLRFALTESLRGYGIETRSHRPSRALREEPAARALLTWAQVAHPEWNMPPSHTDVTHALIGSIAELDLIRAQLITATLYKEGMLQSFDALASGVQERITYAIGERLEQLRAWFIAYDRDPLDEIDLFWSKLFGEVLSAEGFGFHENAASSQVTANLIDSARKFRQVIAPLELERAPSHEYVRMVRDGVIADQYLRSWQTDVDETRVLIAPAYTYLMMNYPVDYQFWLNVGGNGWWERLYQPLTHPYVLTREWDHSEWTDDDEFYARNETMYRIALGLTRRCRKGIYLGFSEFGEQGYEQRGPLLGAIQSTLRRISVAG